MNQIQVFFNCRTVIVFWEGMNFNSFSKLYAIIKDLAGDISFFIVLALIGGNSPSEFHLVSRLKSSFSSKFNNINGDSDLSSLKTSCTTSLMNNSCIAFIFILDKIPALNRIFF